MFFENSLLYSFLYRTQAKGYRSCARRHHAGYERQAGTAHTGTFQRVSSHESSLVDRFGDNNDAMKQAGIAYASEQIIDLVANGVRGIHIYAMNRCRILSARSWQTFPASSKEHARYERSIYPGT